MPSTTRTTTASGQTWLVTVDVDGRNLGTFDTASAVETSADVQMHRPGGMKAQRAYPSLAEHGDKTVGRSFELERDGELYPWLRARIGLAVMSVTEQLLGPDGVVSTKKGSRTSYTGLLKGGTPWEVDSNSNDPSMFELVMSVEDIA